MDGFLLSLYAAAGGFTTSNRLSPGRRSQDFDPCSLCGEGQRLLRPVSREQVENYLYRITYDLLEGVVEEKAQGMSVRQEDKELIATLYKYLFVGLMLDWIKGDMKGDPQVMVQKLELVIHGSVAAALDRMRTDKPASNGAE